MVSTWLETVVRDLIGVTVKDCARIDYCGNSGWPSAFNNKEKAAHKNRQKVLRAAYPLTAWDELSNSPFKFELKLFGAFNCE